MEYELLLENLEYLFSFVRFQFLIVMVMKSSIFWDITPLTGHLHFQGRRISQGRNQREASSKLLYYFGLFFDPEDGGNLFLWKVHWLSTYYKALYTKIWKFSFVFFSSAYMQHTIRKRQFTTEYLSVLYVGGGLTWPERHSLTSRTGKEYWRMQGKLIPQKRIKKLKEFPLQSHLLLCCYAI
jgi:hypothetical protein